MFPIRIFASSTPMTKIGNNYYDSLSDAINASKSGDTITLTSNNILDDTQIINKNIKIDLNGNNIVADEAVFKIQGGALHLTGKGKVYEKNPNYGAVMMYGSDNPQDKDYSVLKVDKDVYLEGWSGIFITHKDMKSYGILVNFDGTINAVNDTGDETGIGIYVNGNIKHDENYPVVNIGETAKITSTGNGLYMAGYMQVNLNGGYIQGDEAAIGMKSGILNMNNGSLISTGIDNTPTSGYNNGIKPSGAALQIESNTEYAGKMKINIKDGLIKSKNSYAVYEYLGKGNNTQVNDIKITGGTFESGKDNFLLSDSLKNANSFISGGKFSTDPTPYLDDGYVSIKENDMYNVSVATMKEVNKDDVNNKPNILLWLVPIIGFAIGGYLLYLRKKVI